MIAGVKKNIHTPSVDARLCVSPFPSVWGLHGAGVFRCVCVVSLRFSFPETAFLLYRCLVEPRNAIVAPTRARGHTWTSYLPQQGGLVPSCVLFSRPCRAHKKSIRAPHLPREDQVIPGTGTVVVAATHAPFPVAPTTGATQGLVQKNLALDANGVRGHDAAKYLREPCRTGTPSRSPDFVVTAGEFAEIRAAAGAAVDTPSAPNCGVAGAPSVVHDDARVPSHAAAPAPAAGAGTGGLAAARRRPQRAEQTLGLLEHLAGPLGAQPERLGGERVVARRRRRAAAVVVAGKRGGELRDSFSACLGGARLSPAAAAVAAAVRCWSWGFPAVATSQSKHASLAVSSLETGQRVHNRGRSGVGRVQRIVAAVSWPAAAVSASPAMVVAVGQQSSCRGRSGRALLCTSCPARFLRLLPAGRWDLGNR